jgi:hypothetical protein
MFIAEYQISQYNNSINVTMTARLIPSNEMEMSYAVGSPPNEMF